MQETTPIALNVNFDSFSEAFGFPERFRDPCYFAGFDRFVGVLNKYGFKSTLYIIAKDLENPEIADRVRDWSRDGHEIASHSWSHQMNLGALPERFLVDEIKRAHDMLSNCIGKPVKGFTAPAWATSRKVVETLVDLDYLYDASVFPSVMLYPVVTKVGYNHIGTGKKFHRAFDRRDWLLPLTASRHPYYVDRDFKPCAEMPERGLVILPVPALSRFRFPLWHTVGFLLGWEGYVGNVSKALKEHPYFYHLMHPADFTGTADLEESYRHGLERMDVPMETKIARLEEIVSLVAASGRKVATMSGLAEEFSSKKKSLSLAA